MATKLDGKREVTRQTIGEVNDRGTLRALLATLQVGDTLELRPLGTRRVSKRFDLIELYQDERFSAPRGRNVIETETMVKHAGALRPLMIERLPGDTYRFWPKGAEAAAVTLSVASMYERACILEGQRKLREKRAGKAK